MKSFRFTVFLIIIAIFAGLLGGAITNSVTLSYLMQYGQGQGDGEGDMNVYQPVKFELVEEESKVISAIEKVSPAVVSIIVTKDLQVFRQNPSFYDDPFFFFDPYADSLDSGTFERQRVGGGTGFIFTEDGLILTNRHVVDDSDAHYTVVFTNGDEYPAEVVDRDSLTDIAVVRILAPEGGEIPRNLPVVQFGDSKGTRVGQRVVAIGNALSEFSNSVTVGVISAKERSIVASDSFGRGQSLNGLLQTDAAINLGNSGGPLVNLAGEVIGVNTAIAAGANGLGFAIPINDIKKIIESVAEVGRIMRPILGVRFIELNEKIAEEYDVEGVTEGALLIGNAIDKEFAVIPGKPADNAGLKEGDVIVSLDGRSVNEDRPLQDHISQYNVGDSVELRYFRDGKEFATTVTLGDIQDFSQE